MDYLEIARKFFAGDKFATVLTGITIEEADIDYAKCKVIIQENHLNALNKVMGGVMYTLADFGFAIASNLGDRPTVTLTSTIDYKVPGDGEYLTSKTRLEREDGRKCYYNTEIFNDRNEVIAQVSAMGYRLDKGPK